MLRLRRSLAGISPPKRRKGTAFFLNFQISSALAAIKKVARSLAASGDGL